MGALGLGNGSLRMDDVYLEGPTPNGPAVVGHLSVVVDTAGITFLGPEPGERRTVGWDRTSPLEFGPPASTPAGEQATALQFVVDGRPLRLLVPEHNDLDDLANTVGVVPPKVQGAVAPVPSELELDPVAPPAPAPVAVEPVAVESLAVEPAVAAPAVAAPVFVDPLAPAPAPSEPPAPILAEPPAPAVAEPPAPVFVEPPTPIPAEPRAPVFVEPPAPIPAEPRAPVFVEPPTPAVAEPPAPVFVEPPTPIPAEPRAPVFVEPPAAVVLEPPVPVLLEPPAPPDRPHGQAVADGVGTDPLVYDEASEELELDDVDDELPPLPRLRGRGAGGRPPGSRLRLARPSRNMVRLVVFTILAGLIPFAAGIRYFQSHGATGQIPPGLLSDSAIAARVGIQRTDLPGWAVAAPTVGNAFAAGATTNGAAALQTAEQASTVMAGCLHVPVSAVDGAFGMGSAVSQVTAEATSPTYLDPSGNGGAVSSVVDVVQSAKAEEADGAVFQDPALFATCYQPYVQAMLPYASGASGVTYATATVQPIVVPVPTGPAPVTVAGFQIARIANETGQTKTVVSTATAVFDGRVQTTMGTVSNLVFSLDAQDQLARDLEIRTIGVSQL